MGTRVKTSINLNVELRKKMKADLAMRGMDMGDWIEDSMRKWLEQPPDSTAEEDVIRGLRKLLKGQPTLLVTFPPLLGVSETTLRKFLSQH